MKFDIGVFFENMSRNFKFHSNRTITTGTLREIQYTFLILPRWILLRMGYISDKRCRRNQNTHSISSNVFLIKIVPFTRGCGKIW